MEVTNEAIVAEIDAEKNISDDLLTQSTELETSDSEVDLLTVANPTEPLVGEFSNDSSVGNITFTQTDTLRILEVTGRGVVAIDTDIAQIQLGIEVEGDTASEVQQEVAQSLSTVVEQLNELEVEELETISVSLQPRREFDDFGNGTVVGFTGRNVLQFEVTTDIAGQTIDAAIEAGANTIQDINFVASDSELNQARLEAVKLAAQDAQNLATPLFDTLDLKPLDIVDIDLIQINSPSARSFFPEFSVASFDAATPIIGGTQDVVAEVALDISYTDL